MPSQTGGHSSRPLGPERQADCGVGFGRRGWERLLSFWEALTDTESPFVSLPLAEAGTILAAAAATDAEAADSAAAAVAAPAPL